MEVFCYRRRGLLAATAAGLLAAGAGVTSAVVLLATGAAWAG